MSVPFKMPTVSVITTEDGRFTFTVTNKNWKRIFTRTLHFDTFEEACYAKDQFRIWFNQVRSDIGKGKTIKHDICGKLCNTLDKKQNNQDTIFMFEFKPETPEPLDVTW